MEVPEVRDRTPAPVSFIKRYPQAIVLGAAAFIVLVVVFSRSGAPVSKPAPTASNTQSPTTADQAMKYMKNLEAQTKAFSENVEREKQKVAAMQSNAQGLMAPQQSGVSQQFAGQPPYGGYAGGAPYAAQDAPKPEPKAESNIALTFRSQNGEFQQQPKPANVVPSNVDDIRNLIDAQKAALASNLASTEALMKQRQVPAEQPKQAPVDDQEKSQREPAPAMPISTKTFKIFEGTVLETVLVNRLNGTFTGPVNVLVASPIYSHDREHVLIPQGTRIMGEATKVGQTGQQRLAVTFHRMVMPDGFSVNLDKFIGANQVGEAGLKDKVDNHWFQVFGTSVALGVIQGFGLAGSGSAFTGSGVSQYRQSVGSAMSQSSTQVLESRLNILPTITIREGNRVRVFLRKDIEIPAYENHQLPGDL